MTLSSLAQIFPSLLFHVPLASECFFFALPYFGLVCCANYAPLPGSVLAGRLIRSCLCTRRTSCRRPPRRAERAFRGAVRVGSAQFSPACHRARRLPL